MIEIERKFLIKAGDDSWRKEVVRKMEIVQGYIARGGATVRIRIQDQQGILCLKGRSPGLTRREFEYPVPVEDARIMLNELCQGRIVAKTRHIVPAAEPGLVWEIDEYHGPFEGHYTAELEIPTENTPYQRPDWLGQEVSLDRRFRNASLADTQLWPE